MLAYFYSALFYLLVETCLETVKGLDISCSFYKNFQKWTLSIDINLGEKENGTLTLIGFNSEIEKTLILQLVVATN